jgi:uncharacterized protein (DUF305 family)
MSSSTSAAVAPSDEVAGIHNDADLAFAHNMLAHSSQTRAMVAMVASNSTDPRLIAFAERLASEQRSDVAACTAWLLQWGADPHAQNNMRSSLPGMVPRQTLDELQSLRGSQFDKLWLQTMIGNQQGGLQMAAVETSSGENLDAMAYAKSLITTGQTDIAEMKRMLG